MSTIHIEQTNEPTIIKFVANKILTDGSYEFSSVEDANNSPLAQNLFQLPFVKSVFITANFIAIERNHLIDWKDVQDDLKDILTSYLIQNKPIINTTKSNVVEVYAESTPNPEVQKFVTNKLLTSQNLEIKSKEDAKEVPLALELFEYPFVQEVFISQNYVSISKDNSLDWLEINQVVRDFLKDYIQSDKPVVSPNYQPAIASENNNPSLSNNDEISKQIISILDEYIRPAVAGDGGNIHFDSYDKDNKIVNVILQGACNGCPSSTITLKNGIESTLKQFLPGKIEGVNALN